MGLFDFFKRNRNEGNRTTRNFTDIRERARSLRQLGRHKEAIELLLGIIDSDPPAISILGNTYKEVGDFDSARKLFLQALCRAESADPSNNFVAKSMATESHANLGELEWEQGNRSEALKHLTRATTYWKATGSERDEIGKKLILPQILLSLMRKYTDLQDYGTAYDWAKQRLQYVPGCSEAKEFVEAFDSNEPSAAKVCILLQLCQDKSPEDFQTDILTFSQIAIDALSDQFNEAVSDFNVHLAKDTPKAMFSCVTSTCDLAEVQRAIRLAWTDFTAGNGLADVVDS